VASDGTLERQLNKLRKDLGEDFLAALADPETVEILLNADGTLWQERLGEPLQPIGTMSASCADAAMRTIAAYHHATLTRDDPSIECELPLDGSRFAGQIPPIVTAPVFAVRKRASRVFTLQQYVDAGIMTPEHKKFLCQAVRDHRNILAIGGTGGGKTTLLNALIRQLTDQYPTERLVIIEDTAEIQCAAKDYVQYHTSPDRPMTQLVRMALRMRPDRILVGEVRGPEALDLLMAWNTGHEGGIASLHANNAAAGLNRLSTLVAMHPNAPRGMIESLIGEAVDVIVHIARTDKGRVVREILEVIDFDRAKQVYNWRSLS
jgi:P-type conjugative transfer ATPase TrbB